MPRRNRCVLPEVPCHITQRGVDRCETFSEDQDRLTYLTLLKENLADAGVRILGYCLMTNHVHLIAVPAREESLSILFRRVHGRYAQYYNARLGRSGHLWQNRFFAFGSSHLWSALAYVERNPVRAGMVEHAADYPWSSAKAHLDCTDSTGLLDMEWWRREAPMDWSHMLANQEEGIVNNLRVCTHAGRPFGEESFVNEWQRSLAASGSGVVHGKTIARKSATPSQHRKTRIPNNSSCSVLQKQKSRRSGCPLYF